MTDTRRIQAEIDRLQRELEDQQEEEVKRIAARALVEGDFAHDEAHALRIIESVENVARQMRNIPPEIGFVTDFRYLAKTSSAVARELKKAQRKVWFQDVNDDDDSHE